MESLNKPQSKCRNREQAAQQKQLGVMRSSRDLANTWSPELKMKPGTDILDLGHFYSQLHKPLP